MSMMYQACPFAQSPLLYSSHLLNFMKSWIIHARGVKVSVATKKITMETRAMGRYWIWCNIRLRYLLLKERIMGTKGRKIMFRGTGADIIDEYFAW